MRFTLSWLKKFLDTDKSLNEIAHKLTMIGLEVEDIIDNQHLKDFEVAQILETFIHPDADKLKVCKVQTKSTILQIVCGAPNARGGIKVVLANVGTLIPNGNFKIKESKIRGIDSFGMMCSYEELGLKGDSAGIIELPFNAQIGDSAISYLGADDPVIDINITPNRADALGVYGIARDLAAAGMGTLKDLEIPATREDFETDYTLTVEDESETPFFSFREIRELKNKESPMWLKNLLENIDVKSISAIVDVTNYISYSFGQPMHAYDAHKINGGLKISSSTSYSTFKALNDKEYTALGGDIVVCDDNQIQSLAGIIGSSSSACNENTTNILLEAANFNPNFIAKTGRRLGINTDSRYRLERNVDREFRLKAMDIATHLILDICGGQGNGKISKVKTAGTSKLPIKIIDFPLDFLEHKANITLSGKQISDILEKLGFVCALKDNQLKITVPSWRYDVSIKEDIVEEIIRIYGYDKIPATVLPAGSFARIIPADYRRLSDIKRILAGCSYNEVVTWSFTDSKKAKYFSTILEELTIQNPISSDLDYMRPSILPNLLGIVRNNLNRSFNNLALFEVGPIFKDTSENVINSVCGIKGGYNANKNCYNERRQQDIFDMKADLAIVFDFLGFDIDKCQIKNDAPSYYHPTRSANICLGKNVLAHFGQVHPIILKKYDIDQEIFAFELNIESFPISKEKYGKRPEYVVSDYPVITRDFAFIVDDALAILDLLNFIRNIDKKLIRSVDLFDVYNGDKIEHGKKSVAISTIIQDDNKTLSENDIAEISKKIIVGTLQKFGAVLRDS